MFAAGAFASSAPTFAFQADRELLDLLLTQEQMQVIHYSAILDTFDDAAFSAAGLPGSARGDIEAILAAEQAHITALERRDSRATPPPPPALTDLIDALSKAVEIENLAVASYAFVIPQLDRQRLLPALIGIHSVEARHAAWLATLLETNPFPEAIDQALTLEQSEANAGEPRDVPPAVSTPSASGDTAWLTAAIADDLGVPPETVQVVSMESRNWPDASLGCPQPDMLYAQVVTPGYLVLVDVSGERIEYHTDERGTVVRCP